VIDVGRQTASLGHGGVPLRDPERCIRDMCSGRIDPDVSTSFCPDCHAYMRGDT